MNTDQLKQQAAIYTIDTYVESGMVLGLGAGSTALHALRRLAERIQNGELTKIVGIPCARAVEEEARRLNVPLSTLTNHPRIDLTFDGADEVDPHLNLIKGGGGALLREKIVAQASHREIIMVDESKLVPVLGTAWGVPVEVVPFGKGPVLAFLKSLGAVTWLRRTGDDDDYVTDQGNYIIDTAFGKIHDPAALADKLNARAGIVAHGLFLGLASAVVVAGKDGIRVINRED